jgi:dTDP-glucose 4,6-dehydratase
VRVLITGGAGFIGHHFCEHILRNTDWEIVSLDRLDTSGNLNRLADLPVWQKERRRVSIVWHDLKAAINGQLSSQIGKVEYVLHLAAASHVDRSIEDPVSFVMDNVVGTANLLEWARRHDRLQRFIYFSTDEVFGPAPPGVFYKEWDRYKSGNPYAATKAGAEELCLAYENTYKMPIMVSHCMNVIGERQAREKYVPSTIRKVLVGEQVLIHADATCKTPGSRFYIHARNVADATLFLLDNGKPGDKYNIVGEREVNNLEMAHSIAAILGKPLDYKLISFHASRPGHDLRYALDGSKMAKMGWKPPKTFEESLEKTVRWTVAHPEWL